MWLLYGKHLQKVNAKSQDSAYFTAVNFTYLYYLLIIYEVLWGIMFLFYWFFSIIFYIYITLVLNFISHFCALKDKMAQKHKWLHTPAKQSCDCVAWSRKRRIDFISRQGVYGRIYPLCATSIFLKSRNEKISILYISSIQVFYIAYLHTKNPEYLN